MTSLRWIERGEKIPSETCPRWAVHFYIAVLPVNIQLEITSNVPREYFLSVSFCPQQDLSNINQIYCTMTMLALPASINKAIIRRGVYLHSKEAFRGYTVHTCFLVTPSNVCSFLHTWLLLWPCVWFSLGRRAERWGGGMGGWVSQWVVCHSVCWADYLSD